MRSIIIGVLILLMAMYIIMFSLAKASSNLHRMEERWEAEKETTKKPN